MFCERDPLLAENLYRWQQSGEPRRWVEAHRGRWTHDDWLHRLETLQQSPYWPLDPEAIGQVLEESRRRWRNLRRWEQSGQARRWVEKHQHGWGHEDWLALLEDLSASPFWPLDLQAVGELLEEIQQEWRNLQRWEQSGEPRRWVEAHQGQWDDKEWKALLLT